MTTENQNPLNGFVRFFLIATVLISFFFIVFAGWLVATLTVADFSGMGNNGPMGSDQYILSAFPTALLVGPWCVSSLLRPFGNKIAIVGMIVGALMIAIIGSSAASLWMGSDAEEAEIIRVMAIIWTLPGLIWALLVQRLSQP